MVFTRMTFLAALYSLFTAMVTMFLRSLRQLLGDLLTKGYYSLTCRMLEDFEREMDHTDSRLRSLTDRVNKAVRKTSGK